MTSEVFEVSRRTLVKRGLGLGVASSTLAGGAMAETGPAYRPRSLSPEAFSTLRALVSRLIPSAGGKAGAQEACAHVYIDRALGAFHAQHLGEYRDGLAELEAAAQREGHTGFAQAPPAGMDALITRMEGGTLTGGRFADGGRGFFNLVRKHAIEGLLSDPMYGGNKDFLGWELIGFHGVQLYYSPETQRLNGKDDRPQRSIADYGGRPMS
jgi:gluconate 2-dehydrogenase gamma chain